MAQNDPATSSKGASVAVAALLALAAAFAAPALPAFTHWGWRSDSAISIGWALSALALILFCAMVGIGINDRPAGLLIDNRNRVSLSKFQAVAWTIVVLSGFIAAVMDRIAALGADALMVAIPDNLLAIMGIAGTSLVAAPFILSLKSAETPPPGQAAATAVKLGDTAAKLGDTADDGAKSVGKVYGRNSARLASWLDLFRGDEVGNAGYPDLGKVQQFLITIGVIVGYCAALWKLFQGPAPATLPDFDHTTVILIGISHAGYLAYKAAPHTATAVRPAAEAPRTQTAV